MPVAAKSRTAAPATPARAKLRSRATSKDMAASSARPTVDWVLARLREDQGPVEWKPRLDGAEELVLTILSQHTSDTNAGKAYQRLVERFGRLEPLADADQAEIEQAIRVAGLSRQKAPRVQAAVRAVLAERGELDLSFLREMPLADAKAWLRRIPGVGPKTAAVTLSFALGMPAFPVDTHIHRVLRRLGLIGPKVTPDQAHDIIEPQVPVEEVFRLHVYLITHGRRVCKALRPRCEACVLAERCPSRRPNLTDTAGALPAKRG